MVTMTGRVAGHGYQRQGQQAFAAFGAQALMLCLQRAQLALHQYNPAVYHTRQVHSTAPVYGCSYIYSIAVKSQIQVSYTRRAFWHCPRVCHAVRLSIYVSVVHVSVDNLQ